MKQTFTIYAAKMRQANREAVATVVALVVIAVVWFVGGIGLAGFDIEVCSTPLWIIGGLVGPWVAAIVAAVVLARCVFADFSLDDEETAACDVAAPAQVAGECAAEGTAGAVAEEVRHG